MNPHDQQSLDLGTESTKEPTERTGDWVAEVAVDAPGKDFYAYAIPPELMGELAVGDGVEVPYGRQKLKGFVLRRHNQPPEGVRLRSLLSHRSDCRIPPELLRLIAWASSYYRCHLGVFLAAAVPAAVRNGIQMRSQKLLLKQASGDVSGLTKRQAAVFEQLPDEPIPLADALRQVATTRPVIQKLVDAGALKLVEEREISASRFVAHDERHALTDEQQVAKEAIIAGLERQVHETFLLYGVTGSGKTLVYMEVAQRVIDSGQQVLIMLPEISLTPQLAARFRHRFPRLAVWHSGFSAGERSEQWARVLHGKVDLVIGTRSALFAPLPNLGLIIVDEEHDGSYKQDSDPRYNGRDLAVVYGQQRKIPVVLGSATPSFESYQNVLQGRYTALSMRQRPKGGQLPTASLVNMRDECKVQGRFAMLSTTLIERIREGKQRQEQAIILLNRRGWSPIVSCQSCGHTIMCPHCDIGMTYHRGEAKLRCHYCDHEMPHPDRCPSCGEAKLSSKGLGTEQLESLLQASIPGLRTIRIDADTVAKKHAHGDLLSQFAEGKADCLVGTQMVAKGLDFARVTTVGVIQADRGLGIPDFRAAERTFQLIAQVAGRAGRGDHPGHVVVQAYDTDAPALRCALSLQIKQFYCEELQHRADLAYPPMGGLVRFLWTGPTMDQVERAASAFAEVLRPHLGDCMLLGPGPSGIKVIKDQVRWHALIKGPSRGAIQHLLNIVLPLTHPLGRHGTRCVIDVDPQAIA